MIFCLLRWALWFGFSSLSFCDGDEFFKLKVENGKLKGNLALLGGEPLARGSRLLRRVTPWGHLYAEGVGDFEN